MTIAPLPGLAIALLTAVAMEAVAWLVHRYVMHGIGWRLHRSHHERREGWFELNDLYGLFFAGVSLAMIMFTERFALPYWVGIGMAVYGVLYALLHDGLIHGRLPLPVRPRRGYLLRLVQAHHIHHVARERDGAVSFGFLYSAPPEQLARRLAQRQRSDG